MKKYVYLLLFMFLFMSFPNMTKANTCMNSEKVKWQEIAKKISYSYDYLEFNEVAVFQIKLINIDPTLIIKDAKSDKTYSAANGELILDGYNSGKNYRFNVYANDSNCGGISLYTFYVSLPYYNSYYKSSLCQGIEDFKYCQKWTRQPSSQSEFESSIKQYKESLEKEDNPNKEKKTTTIFDGIISFYLKYYYIILPIIIIIVGIIIYRRQKKQDLF